MIWDRLFGRLHKIKCPDGTTRLVYHDVDLEFPIYTKEIKTNASANLDVVNQIRGELGSQYSSAVADLLVKIDSANASTQMHYRAAYATYTTNPCKNDDFLQRATDSIRFEEGKYREAGIRLQAISTILANKVGGRIDRETIKEISDQLKGVLQTLTRKPPAAAIAAEMAQVSDNTKSWQKS